MARPNIICQICEGMVTLNCKCIVIRWCKCKYPYHVEEKCKTKEKRND